MTFFKGYDCGESRLRKNPLNLHFFSEQILLLSQYLYFSYSPDRYTGTTSEKLAGFENGLFPIFTEIIQRDVTGV